MAKSTSLSELLHVCHVPDCTAVTMNPFLHQINHHADQHSYSTMLWLGKESAKRERIIFNYRNQENLPSLPADDSSTPKPPAQVSKKETKKFGSSYTAGKCKEFSLFPSPAQAKKKNTSPRSTSSTKLNFHDNSESSFMGVPELASAVQVTGIHLDRARETESFPRINGSCEKVTPLKPLYKVSGKECASSVKGNHSVVPEEKRNACLPQGLSAAENCSPSKRDLSSSSKSSKSTTRRKSRGKNSKKNKRLYRNGKPDARNSCQRNFMNSYEYSKRQKTHKSPSVKSPNKVTEESRMSKSFSSLVDQNATLACEIKKEPVETLNPNKESNPSIPLPPTLVCVKNETDIPKVLITTDEVEVIKPGRNSESYFETDHSPDTEKLLHTTNRDVTCSYKPCKRIKTESDLSPVKNHKRFKEDSRVLVQGVSSNLTTIDLIDEDANHQVVHDVRQRKTQPNNSAICVEAANSSSPSTKNGKIQLPSTEASIMPVCENSNTSPTEVPLYSREHLSYNFVLCDYVRTCLAHCTKQCGLLTKKTALSVQQVLLVLLFLRGAQLEFLRDLCVCSVMKPIKPTSLGTFIVKSTSYAHETLELSLKEFQYVKDFVRFVRPVLIDNVYGCVFVLDGGEPLQLESVRQSINMGWKMSKVNIDLRDMLRSVAASCN